MTSTANKMVASFNAGAEIGYGVTVGAVDDDISMAQALLVWGAAGAIDYKLVRGLDKADELALNSGKGSSKNIKDSELSVKQQEMKARIAEAMKFERVHTERNANMSKKIDLEEELENLYVNGQRPKVNPKK